MRAQFPDLSGIAERLGCMAGALLLCVPLAIWKAIEIILWIIHKF